MESNPSLILFFDFPKLILLKICLHWLTLEDICCLDSAIVPSYSKSNKKRTKNRSSRSDEIRNYFLSCISANGVLFNGVTSRKVNSTFMNWIHLRNISVKNLLYSGDICNQEKTCHQMSMTLTKHESLPYYDYFIYSKHKLKNLLSLDISGCNIVDKYLFIDAINGNWNLTSLNVSYCNGITDPIMIMIAGSCRRLLYLNISSCDLITDRSIKFIADSCKELISFNANLCRELTDKSLLLIANNSNLTDINLSRCRLTIKTVIKITHKCLNVIKLNINMCADGMIDDQTIIEYFMNNDDTKTTINNNYNNNNNHNNCNNNNNNCKYLQSLEICGNDLITDSGINHLAKNCVQLTHLSVQRCSQLIFFSFSFQNLLLLDISENHQISHQNIIKLIQNNHNLLTLRMGYIEQVDDEVIENITIHCTSIEELDISGSNVTNVSLMLLNINCNHLKKLNVSSCPFITYGGLSTMVKSSVSLQQLIVKKFYDSRYQANLLLRGLKRSNPNMVIVVGVTS
eukprot:gene7573-10317_t